MLHSLITKSPPAPHLKKTSHQLKLYASDCLLVGDSQALIKFFWQPSPKLYAHIEWVNKKINDVSLF